MDTCAAIAVVIQVFGFGLVWAFVAGAAAAGRMGHSRRERQPAAQAAHTVAAVAAVAQTLPGRVLGVAAEPACWDKEAMGLPAHQAKVAGVLALVDPTEGTRSKTIQSTGLAAMAGHTALAEAEPVQTALTGRLAEAE